jgi:hypothetical protein
MVKNLILKRKRKKKRKEKKMERKKLMKVCLWKKTFLMKIYDRTDE